MNKKKIEKSLEWFKRKVTELEDALKQSDGKRWFPKKNEQYFTVSGGYTCSCTCYDGNEEFAKKTS